MKEWCPHCGKALFEKGFLVGGNLQRAHDHPTLEFEGGIPFCRCPEPDCGRKIFLREAGNRFAVIRPQPPLKRESE